MAMIHPSSALTVDSNTSIGECVRKMRDHNVGFALIVSYTFPHDLLGIFTERDFLFWIEEIQKGDHWDKSVATLMKRPVKTLSLYDLGKAADFMLVQRIRNLPVIYEDENRSQLLAGVITMQDLYVKIRKELKRGEKRAQIEAKPRALKLAILTKDPAYRKVLHSIFNQEGKALLSDFQLESIVSEGKMQGLFLSTDVAVLDIDHQGPQAWTTAVKMMVPSRDSRLKRPRALVVYNPILHEPRNLKYVAELAKKGHVAAFSKPINVLEALSQIMLWTKR